MNQRRGAPQTGRRFSGANLESLELRLNRSNEKRLRGDYEGRPHSSFSQRSKHLLPALPRKHTQTKARLHHIFTMVFNKLVNASAWCRSRTSSRNIAFKTYAGFTV